MATEYEETAKMPFTQTWVQSWVQLKDLFCPKMARKLRQINEKLNGYEPEDREFESLRAHHLLLVLLKVPTAGPSRLAFEFFTARPSSR